MSILRLVRPLAKPLSYCLSTSQWLLAETYCIRTKDQLHAGFLCLYLNSLFGQMQNDRYSRGIRQRRVIPEDIGSFLISLPEDADQKFIGARVIKYEQLNEMAINLVDEAKADVEALIEGTLDTEGILAGRVKPPGAEEVLST